MVLTHLCASESPGGFVKHRLLDSPQEFLIQDLGPEDLRIQEVPGYVVAAGLGITLGKEPLH